MKYALTHRPQLVTAANVYAGQLHILNPERSADDCRSQAFQEAWRTQRFYKAEGGDIRTSLSLRAFRDGRADMSEKAVIIGDLTALLDFSQL